MTTDETLSFEEGLKELERIVTRMEEGEISLSDSLKFYERGTFLQKRLTSQLESAKLRIQKVAVGGGLENVQTEEEQRVPA